MIFMWDYKSAYRRLHYEGDSAQTAISVLDDYAYTWLRLTFGGKGNPPAWCAVSEMQTNLANGILSETTWKLEDLADNDFISNLPPIERLPVDSPFANAEPTMVLPRPCPFGKAKMFVDDGNAISLDVDNNVQRAQVGVFKSTKVPEHLNNNEAIPRDPPLQGPKNDDMGAQRNQTCLGLGRRHPFPLDEPTT
jgi:hypothetical protein